MSALPRRPTPRRPLGVVTRGTTAPNRLRRIDRWLAATQGRRLRLAAEPLVVDLGYGSAPVTTLELLDRLRAVRSDVAVLGLEIDPARVAAARGLARPGVAFEAGGFELAGRRPALVRALNVLRQYDEDAALTAWGTLRAGLAPGGALVEGTCDEVGRLAGWVLLDAEGPRTLTLAADLSHLDAPSQLAERLPKALIHHNVPGEPVHALLRDLDRAWASAAPLAPFGPRQRWVATVRAVAADWAVAAEPARWPRGEVTLAWAAVAPR